MKVVFIHIPKTGGATFSSILKQRFSPEKTFHVTGGSVTTAKRYYENTTSILSDLDDRILNKVDLIHGHFPFAFSQKFKDFDYITFLRNPVNRVISDYQYLKSTPDLPLYHIVNTLTLKEYVSQNKDLQLDNLQTRLLSGKIFGELRDDDVKLAEENLIRNFKVCGFTEHFNLSLVLLKDRLGWETTPIFTSKNITKVRNSQISEVDLRAVEQYNLFDISLYESSLKKFMDNIRSNKKYYDDQLEMLVKKNSVTKKRSIRTAAIKYLKKLVR